MIPNAAEIARRRVTAATVYRFFVVIPLLISLIPIFEMLNIWFNPGHWNHGENLASIGPLIGVALLLGSAAILWALAPWAARRAIKVPRVNTCPACRYKLQGLNAPQCPECGLTLTPEYLASDLAPDDREPDTVFLRQISVMVLRGTALIACIPLAVWFAASLVYLFIDGFRYGEVAEYLMQAAISGVGLLVAVGVILFARSLAAFIVPQRSKVTPTAREPRKPPDPPAVSSSR